MAEVDVSQISASGPGLSEGKTGEKTIIYITGGPLSVLADGLSATVDGTQKLDMLYNYDTTPDGLGNVEASFVALKPGDYKATIRFKGRQITGSPFKIKITGDTLPAAQFLSKVTVHGQAKELGKAYSLNEFTVDCRSVQPVIGALKVHIKGPERSSANLQIKDNRNGTYKILYKPTSVGQYLITVKIADEHIPGSPFNVRITEFLSTKTY